MENTVKLIGYYGSDEIIACSAWISTSNDLTEEKRSRIDKMIDNLWTNGHETPFEKGILHFIIDSDIASHIHKLKHRISSLNAESARYKQLKDDRYYIPNDWPNEWKQKLEEHTKQGNRLYHQCLEELIPILGKKRAKESSRYFRGYNSKLQVDFMLNIRSFANFIKLRDNEHAQLEIRKIAHEMLNQVQNIKEQPFKYTLHTILKRIEDAKQSDNNTRI